MRLFVVSLAVPFLVCIVGYAWLRIIAEEWLPAGVRPIPNLFWLSTVLVIGSSLTAHAALHSARHDRVRAIRRWTLSTLLLGVGFMSCQAIAWQELADLHRDHGVRLFTATFYLLTGLHAVHVLGGLLVQACVTVRAHQGRYWSFHHPGIQFTSIYWHFIDATWLLVFGTLWFGT